MSACPEFWGKCVYECVHVYFFPTALQYSHCHVLFNCVHVYIGTCMCACVYLHTWRRVYVGQKGLCRLASCPHLLHCHHVCCVNVTTPPPSPLNATVRTPHPLDSQTQTHPMYRLTTNQITSHMQMTLSIRSWMWLTVTFWKYESKTLTQLYSVCLSVHLFSRLATD